MSSCTGFNIETLVLSDTFNTWFQRTNEVIESINSISLLDINVYQENDNSFRGMRILPGVSDSCFKQIQLIDGPFVGFVTGGSDPSNYGVGTTTSPYKLTLRFSGGESAFSGCSGNDQITGNDYVPVSDTSRNGLFRKAPVSSFLREFRGGNNIQVTFDCNTNAYTIGYIELTFNPTFQVSIDSVYEVGPNGSAVNNQSVNFVIGSASQSNVDPLQSTINTSDANRISGFSPFSISGNGSQSQNLIIPIDMYSSANWFTAGQNITFTASITSSSQSTSGIPFDQINVTRTDVINFGWRFGGLASTSNITNTSNFNLTSGLTQMQVKDSPSSQPWVFSGSQTYIYPSTPRYFQINIQSNNSYIYFVHSSSDLTGSNDRFGWSPTLLTREGLEVQNGLVELGGNPLIANNNRNYRVWRSAQTYNQTSPGQPLVFGIR